MKISIVIPAHNEEKRIEKTLTTYCNFFSYKHILTNTKNNNIDVQFLVVLNGCTDNTLSLVQKIQQNYNSIHIVDIQTAGKGLAIIEGFKYSTKQAVDLIGFVDADMATHPKEFYTLIENIGEHDGISASRYMKESNITPKKRPLIKELGRKIIFNPLINVLFFMHYKDFQCGAKIFKKNVIEKILPALSIEQWAFDIELLYLCKKYGFKIKEAPTIWYDQHHSKLDVMGSGLAMLNAIIKLRCKNFKFVKWFTH